MTDQHFESGMGGSQGQGAPGNEYGVGTRDRDQAPGSNEEGMGAGQIPNQGQTSQGNEYGMGNEARDIGSSQNEEGMGAGSAGQGNAGNEYGMGSGRPASEEGMGVIPGHHKHEHKEGKEGGGLLKKVENVFKKN